MHEGDVEDYMKENKTKSVPTFSIIIPMKNAEKYILNALDSIANQKYEDIEVLVIDDNSNLEDKSQALIELWKKRHPQIKIKSLQTQAENRGAGGARNIGLDNAIGKYILFLDSDDQLNENALPSIQNAINSNPSTDIFVLGYQLSRTDFSDNVINTIKLPAGKIQETRIYQIGVNTAGTIWNTCIKRSLFEGVHGRNKIRFKSNCKFEDLPTKVQLFVQNKKKIKSVKHMTHTQFSRPCTSITGGLNLKDMKRLIDANKEIANLKPNVDKKDKLYINIRLAMLPALLSWFVAKCIRNKIDKLKMASLKKEQENVR